MKTSGYTTRNTKVGFYCIKETLLFTYRRREPENEIRRCFPSSNDPTIFYEKKIRSLPRIPNSTNHLVTRRKNNTSNRFWAFHKNIERTSAQQWLPVYRSLILYLIGVPMFSSLTVCVLPWKDILCLSFRNLRSIQTYSDLILYVRKITRANYRDLVL